VPVTRVYRSGRLYGYRWGLGGKVYSLSKHGSKGAIEKSEKQGRAIAGSRSSRNRILTRFRLPKSRRR